MRRRKQQRGLRPWIQVAHEFNRRHPGARMNAANASMACQKGIRRLRNQLAQDPEFREMLGLEQERRSA